MHAPYALAKRYKSSLERAQHGGLGPTISAGLRAFAAALLDRCARLERLLKLAKDAQLVDPEKLDADQLQLVGVYR